MTDNRLLLPMVSNSPRLQIEYMPLKALKLNTSNPRQHSQKQITNIARNIDNIGFVVPCLVDDENRVGPAMPGSKPRPGSEWQWFRW